MKVPAGDDSLVVDISDALSERDRVRFTVQTKTKLSHFAKPTVSVVRQHEEFIWLHDCIEDNDDYAGYIIPPSPPKPDFDASREKLQRLGDGEANMTKEEFSKMKQELEAEYLAIFKKTVAMHEIFLQRLAAHEKFKYDMNFKIFLEYENELSVRSKSKKEKLSGLFQNISRSAHDLVITTSQVATSPSTSSLFVGQSPSKNKNNLNNGPSMNTSLAQSAVIESETAPNDYEYATNRSTAISPLQSIDVSSVEEQYFQKERLILAMYHKSIKEAAYNSERVNHYQKCVAESYLQIAQQLIKLASIEIVPITKQTKDSSNFLSCPLPSLSLPAIESQSSARLGENNASKQIPSSEQTSSSNNQASSKVFEVSNNKDDIGSVTVPQSSIEQSIKAQLLANCASKNRTSDSLKQFLLIVADYLEQARKIEGRIASDEDLKLTDTLSYYKRETSAASDLINRRQRFMAEFETASKNLEKSRQKSRGTNMQYADVIQKQAKENLTLISQLAKSEIADYKARRATAFKKSFNELVELELRHLRAHSQVIKNCLATYKNLNNHYNGQASSATPSTSQQPTSSLLPPKSQAPNTQISQPSTSTAT